METAMQTNSSLLEQRDRQIARGVATAHPIAISRAAGTEVWDVEGKRYLDFVGGIGVLNVGHNHPRVVAAVSAQLQKVTHAAFQVAAYEPYIQLAQRLNKLVGGAAAYKSVFLTTGAEAVENAVKIARSFTNRPAIVAFRGGFHGRTLLGVTLTGFSSPYRQNFGPFPAEIYHSAYPDIYRDITTKKALAALAELFATAVAPERVAAIVVEPVQGDGGFLPAPDDFLVGLREIASRHGIVLVVDEIQTGFGRTGDWFGFQRSGIQPDLVTVAKSLAGGFPLSGVVGRAEILDAPTPGGLGGTYGGNAIACAAALGVLDAFEADNLLERSVALGERLRTGLETLQQKFPRIGEVRGRGSMLAIEMVADRSQKVPDPDYAQAVIDNARAAGLLVIKCGVYRNVIRFLTPLITTDAQIDEALGCLERALAGA